MEEIWLEYVQKLYENSTRSSQINYLEKEAAPRIKMWELRNTIKKGRSHKATGEANYQ